MNRSRRIAAGGHPVSKSCSLSPQVQTAAIGLSPACRRSCDHEGMQGTIKQRFAAAHAAGPPSIRPSTPSPALRPPYSTSASLPGPAVRSHRGVSAYRRESAAVRLFRLLLLWPTSLAERTRRARRRWAGQMPPGRLVRTGRASQAQGRLDTTGGRAACGHAHCRMLPRAHTHAHTHPRPPIFMLTPSPAPTHPSQARHASTHASTHARTHEHAHTHARTPAYASTRASSRASMHARHVCQRAYLGRLHCGKDIRVGVGVCV